MSETVSQALFLTGGKAAFETAYFIGKIDKLFDCLNVTSMCEGKKKRKVFQNPYRRDTDFRIKVCFNWNNCWQSHRWSQQQNLIKNTYDLNI